MIITTKVKYFSVLLAALLLASCATMSKDECRSADWYIKGLADASDGYALDRLDDHAKACARAAVTPKAKDYEAGHKKGARLYCVPDKGYSEGRNGASYNGICPRDLEGNFLRAYRHGQELFVIQQKINLLAQDISHRDALIEANYNEIHRLKHDIVASDSSPQERRNKLRRIDELQYEITDFEVRIDRDAYEIELLKNDYRFAESRRY